MKYILVQFYKLTLKVFAFVFIFILFTHCSTSKLFERGETTLKNKVETLPIDFSHKLPIVEVKIDGKTYHFLIDTGAPSVISYEVYNDLNLKPEIKKKITDSQGQKKKQILTLLPEMKVGDILFNDIPVAVLDWSRNHELTCRNIDGILGSNQMANSIWKFNYQKEIVEITKDSSVFDVSEYDYKIPFEHHLQKTPLVDMQLFNKTTTLIFDTGSNGRIKITQKPKELDTLQEERKIEQLGSSSAGIYGVGKASKNYIFKASNVAIGNLPIQDAIISTSGSSTIGNEMLKHFTFIVNWNKNIIYLKRLNDETSDVKNFGFGYTFVDDKAIVTYVYQSNGIPLEVGDTIIDINDRSYENLNPEKICEFTNERIEKDIDEMDIKIQRNDTTLTFHLKKKQYLK